MANLGNAWHIPFSPEPHGMAGMRNPVGGMVPGATLTLFSGNQFHGDGNPGNQLEAGSAVLYKRAADTEWRTSPMLFQSSTGNNKFYAARVLPGTFQTGDVAEYYLRVLYDDHETTFVHRDGDGSVTTDSEDSARGTPFSVTVEDAAVKGQWGPSFGLPNVAIHAHLLPTGRVLMWGRRDQPDDSLDVHACTPFVWNPANGISTMTPQPRGADGGTVNLFCSGHGLLPDGRLLVVGGHFLDGDGISYAGLYDATTNTWTPTASMTTPSGEEVRRWYPTVTMLGDGRALVASGSYVDPAQPPGKQTIVVDLLQVWNNGAWETITKADGEPLNYIGLPLYPRLHGVSTGLVFMSGTNDRTLLLKTTPPGQWTDVGSRSLGNRDYCPAALYDTDKVVYIGGGNDVGTLAPTAGVEIIDLAAVPPQWRRTGSMIYPRRQHNAVVLPDGTVLVTGGTRGGGGPNQGFNDLSAGQPVHQAELWDPATGRWSELGAEDQDRCYHSTAVLLPDATVLSAGGGEYRPDNINDNLPEDSHRNGQVFSPPYLFKGPRPQITSAPASVHHGQGVLVTTPQPAQIARVSLLRLASVTHSFDENQRIHFLPFTMNAAGVTVTIPASANACPPGHYLLFLLSIAGVPSMGSMVHVQPALQVALGANKEVGDPATIEMREVPDGTDSSPSLTEPAAPEPRRTYLQVYAREAEVTRSAAGMPVVVGITGTCPYGIGACWGGAYEALRRLDEVDLVAPIPNTEDSTAELYLRTDTLPPIERWPEQFRRIVNGTYILRGVEVTLHESIEARGDELFLVDVAGRPPVRLVALAPAEKIQWDHTTHLPKPLEPPEAAAYASLVALHREGLDGRTVTVTGPLTRSRRSPGYEVHVRAFVV